MPCEKCQANMVDSDGVCGKCGWDHEIKKYLGGVDWAKESGRRSRKVTRDVTGGSVSQPDQRQQE